jgi:hypothetical protein
LFLAILAFILWYLIIPKKECFTVVLRNGVSYEGHIRYVGKRDAEALRAEIIDTVQRDNPDEEIKHIFIG